MLSLMARRVWFFADDWDFLLTRGTIGGESRGWLESHNGHWSTAVVAIYRALFAVVGLRHYEAYAAVLIAMHVAVCVLVYVVLVRVGLSQWTAVGLTCLVVFCGVGSQAMVWTITLSLVGSLLSGLAAILLLLRSGLGRRAVWGVWALLLVALMFSGGGISSVCLVAGFAACQGGIRRGLQVAAVPAAAFVLWYVSIGHIGGPAGPGSAWQFAAIPGYVWTGLTSCVELASGVPSGGPLILLLLLVGAFTLPGPEALRHLAWAGVAAVLLNSVLVAGFRASAGEQSRYYYVVMVLVLPALALWVINVPRWLRAPRVTQAVLVTMLLAAYLMNALHLQYEQFQSHETTSGKEPELVTGIVSSLEAGEKMLTPGTGQWFNGDFRADLIGRPELREALPAGKATAAGRLDAERWFFVDVGDEGQSLPGPTSVDFEEGFPDRTPLTGAGCRFQKDTAPRTTMMMPTGDGAEIRVTSRATRVSTSLTRGRVDSAARLWQVSTGTVHIATTAKNAELEVVLERDGGDGDVIICVE
jgi:hypothetical protein